MTRRLHFAGELRQSAGSCSCWGGQYLHTVPGSQVFVDDLPSGQVAHATGDLDGHVDKVLLGDRLQEPTAATISPVPAGLLGLLCPSAPSLPSPHRHNHPWTLMKVPYSKFQLLFLTCQEKILPPCNCLSLCTYFCFD